MSTPPVYINSSEIGRKLGYVPHKIISLLQKWKSDPEHPCPTPDAYVRTKDGYLTPLWLPSRTEEWEQWDRKRLILARRRQSEGGKKGRRSYHEKLRQIPTPEQ